ncbi:MAG: hypothetical protein ACLQPH_15925 [Acidimicrobiales bacterium]
MILLSELGRFFVQSTTLLRWNRYEVRRKWTHPKPSGRAKFPAGTVQLVVCLARENEIWGYRRIHGELDTRRVLVTAVMAYPAGAEMVQPDQVSVSRTSPVEGNGQVPDPGKRHQVHAQLRRRPSL